MERATAEPTGLIQHSIDMRRSASSCFFSELLSFEKQCVTRKIRRPIFQAISMRVEQPRPNSVTIWLKPRILWTRGFIMCWR